MNRTDTGLIARLHVPLMKMHHLSGRNNCVWGLCLLGEQLAFIELDPEEVAQLIDVSGALRYLSLVKGDLLLQRTNPILLEVVHLRLLPPQTLVLLLQPPYLLVQQVPTLLIDQRTTHSGMRVLRGGRSGPEGKFMLLRFRPDCLQLVEVHSVEGLLVSGAAAVHRLLLNYHH